jgi:hypothetical protein
MTCRVAVDTEVVTASVESLRAERDNLGQQRFVEGRKASRVRTVDDESVPASDHHLSLQDAAFGRVPQLAGSAGR